MARSEPRNLSMALVIGRKLSRRRWRSDIFSARSRPRANSARGERGRKARAARPRAVTALARGEWCPGESELLRFATVEKRRERLPAGTGMKVPFGRGETTGGVPVGVVWLAKPWRKGEEE